MKKAKYQQQLPKREYVLDLEDKEEGTRYMKEELMGVGASEGDSGFMSGEEHSQKGEENDVEEEEDIDLNQISNAELEEKIRRMK